MSAEGDRAYEDGKRDARLDGHDRMLQAQREDSVLIVNVVTSLDKQVQRLGDNAKAVGEATIKLAEAVNAEKNNARDALMEKNNESESRWSRRDSWMALLVGAVGTFGTFYAVFHK